MQRQQWSKSERNTLFKLILENTSNNRINWRLISAKLNRTANQCRKQYNHQTKSLNLKKNKRWSGAEFGQLFGSVIVHGKKWELIRKLQFPNLTAEQLKKKYELFEKRRKQGEELVRKILNGEEIQKQEIPHLIIQYKHFTKLLHMYDNVNQMDMLSKQAVLKTDQDFNIRVSVAKMKEILTAHGIEV
ncbi:Myb-like_DNA-binding domain-containing protein [Hexamita inflata]|uniref:Myb-like DNA-binding domain-containing protein n=1 Tax=Hexamita inflata TaxID=28002 RepID=A0AA86NLX8_9EUKA|nr:Myb-like DNA-binding domain-containing protein [Hexamita inflata]